MNTFQIKDILSRDKQTKPYFLGVFARDELPTISKYPACFIFNTDKRNEPGQHWLAIYFVKDKNAEFFDSLGYSPSFYKVDKFLDRYSKKYIWNEKRIQGFFSKFCGLYCVFYLYLRFRNKTLKNIQELFDLNFEKNDLFIEKLIKEIE